MRREEINTHAGIISEKAACGMLSDDAKLRSRLRLCRANANSDDYLLKESYEWTPELLSHDFLPRFTGEDQPRRSKRKRRKDVLAEIGHHFCRVHRVWQRSKLGTSRFESMKIEEMGLLERTIKGSLQAVVELVYKMMLARWMERRKRPAAWWTSFQLRERNCFGRKHESLVHFSDNLSTDYLNKDSQANSTQAALSDIVELNDNLQDAIDGESVEHNKVRRSSVQLPTVGGFRRPSTVNLVNHPSGSREKATELSSSSDFVIAKPLLCSKPIRDCGFYPWTEKDVEAFTHDAKRIADVRAAMVDLCDRLNCRKVSREVACVTETETRPALFAEEREVVEVASALTMKRTLPVTGANPSVIEDNSDSSASHVTSDEPSIRELQKSVRNAHGSVADLLSLYDGQQSAEWRDVIFINWTCHCSPTGYDLAGWSCSGTACRQ
ncbi:unnamed protein product [Peronospora belbahrii]|uniref:Uncharacterized protein n=1 Tax=Peronospora belbahrii TaxID=622444 RepID=A0AAU9KLX2_9STRA|nr:unnamed protein product [Peronospora belbahrii]